MKVNQEAKIKKADGSDLGSKCRRIIPIEARTKFTAGPAAATNIMPFRGLT
jgi:hypothetical protein